MEKASRLERLIRSCIPYSWLILIAFVALTAFCAKPALKLLSSISTTLSTLLPEDFPSVSAANEIKDKFRKKGGGDLVVILDSPDADANFKALKALEAHVLAHPAVERVKLKKAGYDFFEEHKLLFLDMKDLHSIRDRVQRKIQREKLGSLFIDLEQDSAQSGGADPFTFDDLLAKYRDEYVQGIRSEYFTNDHQTIYAMWLYPKSKDTSLKYFKEFYQVLSAHIATFPSAQFHPQMNIAYAGSIKTRIDEYDSLIGDLQLAGMLSMFGVFTVLLLFFRRVIGVLLLFLPLGAGIFIGFALCSLFIENLNVVTSFLFSILFGMGIDIGIHMFLRYIGEREAGVPVEDAIVHILLKTGRSSSVAVLTTVASFFILVINDFRGFSEFGWIAGIGLTVTLVCYLLMYPAVLVVAEKNRILRFKAERHEKLLKRFDKYTRFPFAKEIVIAGSVILVLGLATIPFVEFEWNYGQLKIQVPETVEAREKLKLVSGRVNSPAGIVISGKEDAMALKEDFARRKEADTVLPTIDKFRSYYDINPDDQDEKMKVLAEIDHLLSDDALNVLKGEQKDMVTEFRQAIAETKTFPESAIPEEVRDSFFGIGPYASEQIAFIYPRPNLELDDGRNAIAFHEDVFRTELNGKTFFAASDAIVFAEVLETMFTSSRIAISLSALVLIFLVWFDFRDFRQTAQVVGILTFGLASMFGCVWLFGWKFNFYNMVTIPITIGMGEDNSVHMVHRHGEFGRKNVMQALLTSGVSAFMSSLTTLIGYAGLLFAHHPGLRSIGLVAVTGIITCMIGSLVILPALLQLQSDREEKKRLAAV